MTGLASRGGSRCPDLLEGSRGGSLYQMLEDRVTTERMMAIPGGLHWPCRQDGCTNHGLTHYSFWPPYRSPKRSEFASMCEECGHVVLYNARLPLECSLE